MRVMATATNKTSRIEQRFIDRIQRRSAQSGGIRLTSEAYSKLQALEAKLATDPEVQIQFGQVKDFLAQWQMMNPQDQEKLGQKFSERAKALVDIPFQQKTTDLRSNLERRLGDLNLKYKFMTDAEQMKLKQSLGTLDNDTVQQLSQAFQSIEERGLGNSGAMAAAANAIINDQQNAVAKTQQAFQLNQDYAKANLQSDTTDLLANAAIEQRNINQEQTVAREEKKNQLIDRSLQADLLTQIMSGATDLAPKNLSTYQPSALNPDTLPNVESPSVVSNIPPAERIRAIRTGINTPPQAPSTNPQKPTDTSGMTIDQRRQIRLSRLNSSQ